MTPHHLDALAAAHSLAAARQHLAALAEAEAAQIAAERLEVPAVLRSTVWGGRHGSGGHSDPTPGMIAVRDRPERRNRWAEMAERLDGKLDWLAGQLHLTDGIFPPLECLIDGLPALQPGTAALVARHLHDEDRWLREAIGVGPTRAPLLGVDCPACAHRELYVQVAGPEQVWTVVCAGRWDGNRRNPCLCLGADCGCGMPGAVEGVAHIWPRAAVIGAVAGAAPSAS